MKKIKLLILLLLIPLNIEAAKLEKCIDGDTASFIIDGKIEKVRFLAINTKESTNKQEKYGKEASEYTCSKLLNAKEIRLELDKESAKYDKYNRLLAWVFVDEKLLQYDLLKKGHAEIKYIYGEYKYLDSLKEAENYAKINKLGIWQDEENSNELLIIVVVIIASYFIYKGDYKKTKKILRKLKL